MIVTAAMSYYDDDLELLDQSLRSLPLVADRLVVVDGRYSRYMPDAPASSPASHVAFIKDTCRDIGLNVKVEVPRKVFNGQVEKRNRLLTLAAQDTDWILGVDADHVLHASTYSVRHEIGQLEDEDAVDVHYYTPMNHDRPLKDSAAGQWHESLAGDYAIITALWRALPGFRVEKFHWWYSALKDRVRHWLWGGDSSYPKVKAHSLKAPLLVEHKCLFRQEKHVLANRAFCEDRERIVTEHGQEDPR